MTCKLLLPLLLLATGISSSPHGYQYQLPKEYDSYSHGNSGSYSQLEPFRRFLRNYMSSQDTHPYQYMKHPMANVQVRSEMPKPSQYHHHKESSNMARDKYMVGELFFKNQEGQDKDDDSDSDKLPYNVIEKFQNYETRYYPSATYVCNKTKIDTAADPLAGLERMNPYEVMMSRRYQKRPKSQMFQELFKYIQGENQEQEKIEMTSPVVMFHKVTKETTIGDYEDVEMCFYLPHRYQENHEHLKNQRHHESNVHDENHDHHEHDENHEHHEHDENHEHHEHNENHEHQGNQRHKENNDHQEDHEHQDEPENLELDVDAPSFRHAAVPPPKPMDNGRVYLYTRPAMHVYVRTFGGFALTHQTWEEQREILEDDILGKKYNAKEYFTASYDNPWKLGNKRNEVWIQCLEPFQTLPGDVAGELTKRDLIKKHKSSKAENTNKSKTLKD